jgi:cytochrome c oxidase subunit III
MPEHQNAVAHQFDTIEQQREADTLGMWTFLATEVMFFGGLIMCYTFARFSYPQIFEAASHRLFISYGGINTAILLCSSLTMALAVRAAQLDRRNSLITFLIITALFGLTFLVVKGFEYHTDYVEELVPGWHFKWEGTERRQAELFFWLYFTLTGLHALHVAIGVGILATMAVLAIRNQINSENYMPAEITGLYWHFVDIVWIFLFPLLYLSGHRQI